LSFALGASAVVCAVGGGCSEQVSIGYDVVGGGGSSATAGVPSGGIAQGGGSGGSRAGAGGSASCEPVACRGKIYACGNCDDDDGDGLADALDPECLGPCDDSESAFASPGPGQTSCRLDCAFDRDAGLGNDRCSWDLRCDPRSPGTAIGCASTDDSVAAEQCGESIAGQAEACVDSCAPLTPNGCDCFGCCELPARSGTFVWIGSGADAGACSAALIDEPDACPPCTPVPSCENRCDVCEACVGGVGPSSACAEPDQPACGPGAPPCGPGAACSSDRYCVTGCCIVVPT
jgi:hypothetical protein